MKASRSRKGSIAAEHMAALIVLFLGLFFPLCNLATCFFRYGLVLQAVHNGSHYGSKAQTWTAGTSTNAVMTVVPATVNNFVNSTKGVRNQVVRVRILETRLSDGLVTRLADNSRLPTPPKAGYIYSLETTVALDIDPLISFKNNLVPDVPGMTRPYRASITTRELMENPDGMVN
jgi:hypothetical protein